MIYVFGTDVSVFLVKHYTSIDFGLFSTTGNNSFDIYNVMDCGHDEKTRCA